MRCMLGAETAEMTPLLPVDATTVAFECNFSELKLAKNTTTLQLAVVDSFW